MSALITELASRPIAAQTAAGTVRRPDYFPSLAPVALMCRKFQVNGVSSSNSVEVWVDIVVCHLCRAGRDMGVAPRVGDRWRKHPAVGCSQAEKSKSCCRVLTTYMVVEEPVSNM